MKPYREMSKEELASLKEQLTAVYKEYQGKNLSLNMARGKPSPDQLDLSLPMLDVLNRIPFLYPRRNGKYALVQAGQGEIPLPGSRL